MRVALLDIYRKSKFLILFRHLWFYYLFSFQNFVYIKYIVILILLVFSYIFHDGAEWP